MIGLSVVLLTVGIKKQMLKCTGDLLDVLIGVTKIQSDNQEMNGCQSDIDFLKQEKATLNGQLGRIQCISVGTRSRVSTWNYDYLCEKQEKASCRENKKVVNNNQKKRKKS